VISPGLTVHNVFHVSLLDRYAEPVPGQQPSEPQPAISAEDSDEEEWEVELLNRGFCKEDPATQ
jgi:hypothetical protein